MLHGFLNLPVTIGCIHRRGWRLVLHPDGTTTAYGPDGQVLHSHSPPTLRAG